MQRTSGIHIFRTLTLVPSLMKSDVDGLLQALASIQSQSLWLNSRKYVGNLAW